ncbi:hypothetical protein SAMN05421827_106187 [Pedobacter terrae]|uniref:Uncharacterized protein n=1 Tax=Pedobacter terrae TaxID=405671 RepID=A0A1G7U5T4_9SPHI|nr:hypothetical protein [Pedobacter terrae]SDG42787.1 hypothetical protein SAMN05421827_106187 [Pedobacter terrae]
MLENITGKLLMAVAIGAAFGLFYTLLLNMHGFTKIKYKHVALSIGTVIFLLGLHSFEAAGIACFIIGIGIFVLAIALMARGAADSLKALSAKFSTGSKPQHTERLQLNKPGLSNYVGVLFHLVVIILISLSIFTYSNNTVLNQENMDRLISDAIFQFTSTIMLILLGIFNPFVSPSAKLLGIANRVDSIKYPKLYLLLADKKFWIIFKALICISIILYFASKGYFNLLAWDNATPYMNVYVLLIGFFIIVNLAQMIRSPEYFFQNNLFRITMLLQSAFISIFLSAILVFATLFISSILGVDINKLKVSSEAIIFLGFNIIMCYNEFRLARA